MKLGVIKHGNHYTSQIGDKSVATTRKPQIRPGSPGSRQQGAKKAKAGETLQLDHAGFIRFL